MPGKLRFVSLNIEQDRHLDSVERFLIETAPDVVCLQEVTGRGFERLTRATGWEGTMEPQILTPAGGDAWGVAILSRLPLHDVRRDLYNGSSAEPLQAWADHDQATIRRWLLRATVAQDGLPFRVATTHFVWTHDGEADDLQRSALKRVLDLLADEPELVLAGDFNAPRGGEIFGILAGRYRDNIPEHYRTSLDPVLHRAGHLERMVDGLFTSGFYRTQNVRLVPGVSDHQAIVAEIGPARGCGGNCQCDCV